MQNVSLKVGSISDHNIYRDVDSLYEPLRQTLDPYRYAVPADALNVGSRIANQMRVLTPQEIKEIRDTTLIPTADKLIPTNDLRPVMNSRMVAINSQSAVGTPLTPQQVRQMFAGKTKKEEVVVYQLGDMKKNRQVIVTKPLPPDAETVTEILPKVGTYQPRLEDHNDSGIASGSQGHRYNFYSMIDEPVNRVIEGGCNFGLCTMPDNHEFFAQRKSSKRNWTSW